ncbi:TPA: hypothetical protein N0F65_000396 [Lagenidium giganteum]|uniref:LicD/FKTN/FKRP nucleotidyltransferase domain-containing protein n=1 Tax=Lagenidium giganteum TaxID=4803 RepID=A0AAV2Z2Y1_9STRA|nr:TPA: hypothetical protein N0F65_000396 [Lagenidium giganteum]
MEFVREGACWKRHQVQGILIMLIKTFHELLTKLKVTHWIDSATLLGAVRHGGIVPYDIDADFGIDQAGYEYLRDTKVDVPDWFALHVWNTTVNGADHRDEWIPIRFIHNVSGIYIDTFVFLEEEDYYGRTLMGPARSGAFGSCDKCIKGDDGKGHFLIPSEWVYPLERCRFEDFIVPCPKEAAKYLEFMFGPDYRTPVQ